MNVFYVYFCLFKVLKKCEMKIFNKTRHKLLEKADLLKLLLKYNEKST